MILEVIVSIPQTLKGSAVFSNALLSLITIDAYNTLLWFKGEGSLMTSSKLMFAFDAPFFVSASSYTH